MAREVVCPRCGTRMEYRVEVELGNGIQRRSTYYYRCPRCGYRILDLVVTVKRDNGRVRVEIAEYLAARAAPARRGS